MRMDIRELEHGDKFTFIMGTKNHYQVMLKRGTYKNLVTGDVHWCPVKELIVETVE